MKISYRIYILTAIITMLLLCSCKKNQKLYFYCDPQLLTPDVKEKIAAFKHDNSTITIETVPADYYKLLEELPDSKTLHILRYSSDVFSAPPVKEHLLSPGALFDNSFISDFNEKVLATVTFNNILYGIPDISLDTVVLYYNGNLVNENEKEKLSMQSLPWFLRKKKDIPYGLVYNQYDPYIFYNLLSGSGLKLSSAKDYQNFYSKETIKLFNQLSGMINNEQIPTGMDSQEARNLFLEGKSLLYLSYYCEYNLLKSKNDKIGILEGTGFIKRKTTPVSWSRSYAYGLAGVMDETKKDVARAFITYMVSNQKSDYFEHFKGIPAQKDLITEEQEKILTNTHIKPSSTDYSLYYKTLYEIMLKYYNNRLSLDETVSRIHKKLNND